MSALGDLDRRDFMSRVMAWPGDDTAPGYVNLHWLMPDREDPTKSFWVGKATRNIDEFEKLAEWAGTRSNIRDIYYCTSLQAKTKQNSHGKTVAYRRQEEALAMKAIWLDVDVKEPPKGYPTLVEALEAIMAFVATTGLPRPSAIVGSGGGVHVYWISDRSLSPEIWRLYAHGLKHLAVTHGLRCDAGVTIDAARVLRVPETLNYKTEKPKPVKLLKLRPADEDYEFAVDLKALLSIAPPPKAASAGGIELPEGFGEPEHDPRFGTDSLAEGIEREFPPIAWEPVAKQCAFIRKALATGGKEYSQSMWNLATLAATFMEEGHALAHRMGRRHEGYSRETTDALWDRKTKERKDRGLGWPSCNAIQANGCGDCAACPHFGKIKSPLNLAVPSHKHADTPVLEQMNRDFSAGYIGNKFRIAKFDVHPRFPLQRHVEFLSKEDFINGVRNPLVETSKFDKTGKPDGTKKEPRGAYWFGLPDRSEFDAVTFRPGAPAIIEVERAGRVHRTINTFSGFSVVPDHVDSAVKCAKYLAHVLDNIAGGNEELFNYILDWMASGVQYPDNPGRTSISMRGDPGCGKGVFALGYGRLFGQHFLHATNKEHVTGKFNAHQAETCLIFVDEALFVEVATDAQILKTMVSETTKLLERKGIDAIQIDSYARQILATNNEHPIQIEHNDRRYPAIYAKENEAFANETDERRKAEKRKAYFIPIIEELKTGGSEALLGFLLDRDIHKFNAEAIPETSERSQQKLNSASAGDKTIIEFAQDACLPGAVPTRPWIARSHGQSSLPKHLQTPGLYDVMKARGGTKLAHMSDTALARILKDWGFTAKPLGSSRGWAAPPLSTLRKSISVKFPAVEFDDREEWIGDDAPYDNGQNAKTPTSQNHGSG
jgi:Family of unknown function (DUF5906)